MWHFNRAWTKRYYVWGAAVVLLFAVSFAVPRIAQSWPTNHLDSSIAGNKPYCTSCHHYESGYLTIETVRGKVPVNNKVTVNKGGSFEVKFRTQGFGYGRFTVSGAVRVPDTNKWILSDAGSGDGHTPWFVAKQTTINGASSNSPIIWTTKFSADSNSTGQLGVTPDDGASPPNPFVDRNRISHDEEFTVTVTANPDSNGTYYLYFWGVGTTSAGVLGYNQQVLEVNVTNDTTAPTAPTNITCVPVSSSSIRVDWSGAGDNVGIEGYEIYRAKVSGGPYEYIDFKTDSFFVDTSLRRNTNYYYKIRTVDTAGNQSAGLSPEGTSKTNDVFEQDSSVPLVPSGMRALVVDRATDIDPTAKAVRITWNANKEDDVVGYSVYRSSMESGIFVLASELVSLKEQHSIDSDTVYYTVYWDDTAIKYGSTYYYKVKAIDLAGNISEVAAIPVKATPMMDAGKIDPHGNFRGQQGLCQYCHSTHSSRGKELIFKDSITDACYVCHDGSQSKFNVKSQFDPVANPSHHRVPEGRYSCDVCHNPHYSKTDNPKLLSAITKEPLEVDESPIKTSADKNKFCWACHGENSDLPNPFGRDHKTAYEESKHSGITPKSVATQITCLNCHNSHGARDYPLLVSSNSANFCILCHLSPENNFDKFYVLDDDGTVMSNVYTRNFSNDFLGTAHEKQFYGRNACTVCHEPHGSQERYMLLQPYNDKYTTYEDRDGEILAYPIPADTVVYGPVTWENDAQKDMLCFRCHDEQYYIGIEGNGEPTIGSKFGSGNAKNLHTHVTDWKMSCRTCHDPHSGESDYHIDGTNPLNNTHYVNFDWAKAVGVLDSTDHEANKLAFEKIGSNEAGYTCALKCHGFDHWDSSKGVYKNYLRTGNTPPVKCAGCHDYDKFDTNSRHPVLWDDPRENKVECTTCHLEDHTLHTNVNPYGLKTTIVTDFIYNSVPLNQTTVLGQGLPQLFNPETGVEVQGYGKYFCWQCHGLSDVNTRTLLGDKYTLFEGKPHSGLQREGRSNPYGEGLDSACLVCHNQHNSTNVRLIRTMIDGVPIDAATDRGKINACLACHDGSPGWSNIAAKYNAPSSAGHFIKNDPTKKLLCTECHCPHGSTNEKYMLDYDKYNTGVTWPANRNNDENDPLRQDFEVKDFCITCHPYSTSSTSIFYDTTETIGAGVIELKPLPDNVNDHKEGGRACEVCHDPHKPWPATGGEDKCYDCHSRPNGEATDIRSLAGLDSPGQNYPGLPSRHIITDGSTANNTCMQRCHTAHPHSPRESHLKSSEKTLCLGCHDHEADASIPSPRIDKDLYNATVEDPKPHDYTKPLTTYMDGSAVLGNCDKCHVPHGSYFEPLLRNRKDELCVGCHNGVTTGPDEKPITDIKTMYSKAGHKYVHSEQAPDARMFCDECHVPHGSSNSNYLRDSYAPLQSITYDGVPVNFPANIKDDPGTPGVNEYRERIRSFCIVCHIEYDPDDPETKYVTYKSETSPTGEIQIHSVPLAGANNVEIPEHTVGDPKPCTDCHNAHDPEPVGSNKDCFLCHGKDGYAYRIEPLTGLNNVFPGGQTKASYHPIFDPTTENTNDCMKMCHTQHVHNPRASVLEDRRPWAPQNDSTPPAAPASGSVTAEATSGNQIEISFTASTSEDVFGYYIYKYEGGQWVRYGIVNSKSVSPDTIFFYDSGVLEGGSYSYKVSAFDKAGQESALVPAAGTTAVIPLPNSDLTPPDIPTNVQASAATDTPSTKVVLTWLPAKDNYLTRKYYVYRYTQASPTPVLVGSTGTTSFHDGGLTPNSTYYYRVKAVDTQGNMSDYSAPVVVTTKTMWELVQAGNYWTGADPNKISYKLMRASDDNCTTVYMNSTNMKVQVTTPPGYFGTLTDKKVELFHYAANTTLSTDKTYTSVTTSLQSSMPDRIPARDEYTWIVPMPGPPHDECSIYTVRVTLDDGDPNKKLVISDTAIVAPTVKFFYTDNDTDFASDVLQFAPGTTLNLRVTGDNPNPFTTFTGSIKLFDSKGTEKGSWALAATDYNTTNGWFNKAITLPNIPTVTDDNWYTLRVSAQISRSRRGVATSLICLDGNKQILIRKPDTGNPTQPGAISVGGKTPNTVTLSWGASTDAEGNLAGYKVFQKKSTDPTYLLAGTTINTNFTVNGLTNDTQYDFKVAAYDKAGNSSTDRVLLGSGATRTEVLPVDTTPPNPVPTENNNIRAQADSSSSITVKWSYPSPDSQGVVGFVLFRSADNQNYQKIGAVQIRTGTNALSVSSSYTDTDLKGDTTYYYKVAAYDRKGNLSDALVPVSMKTKVSGDDSIEGALCMSCHDGSVTDPFGYEVNSLIGTAYYFSKHNIDMNILTFKDGSVYQGNCLKCHVAHGSDYDKLLRQADDNELCYLCHTSASSDSKYSGKSYYEASAHGQAPGSNYEFQSDTPRYWPGWLAGGVPARTSADAGKCYNCHAPHGKYVPGTENTTREYIKASTWRGTSTNLNDLCYTCHSDSYQYGVYQGETVYKATYHGKEPDNRRMKLDDTYGPGECSNCHDPHGTAYPDMLKYPINAAGANKNKLCLTCHDRADIVADTGLFAGSAIYNKSKHGEKAKWLESMNDGEIINKTSFLPGVCMNCHNSHGAANGTGGVIEKMLVVEDGSENELCNKCHEDPAISSLRNSYPGDALFQLSPHHDAPGALWPGGAYYPEPQSETNRGKCINCHDPHGTAKKNPDGSLKPMKGATFDEEEQLCYTCHRGQTAEEIAGSIPAPSQFNMKQFSTKNSGHMPWITKDVHSFNEDLNNVQRHAECQDCHNVHRVESTGAGTLSQRLSKALKGNTGVRFTADINQPRDPDWPTPPAPNYTNYQNENYIPFAAGDFPNEYEYEEIDFNTLEQLGQPIQEYMLCFKCHSTYKPNSGGKRIMMYMNPQNASSHGWDPGRTTNTFQNPHINAAANTLLSTTNIPELANKTRTQLTCSDCHGNSAGSPRGPHGSNQEYMLLRNPRETTFCTYCHVNLTNALSNGSAVHSRAQHNSPVIVRNAAGTVDAEKMDNFSTRFGNNSCRYCHYAGHYMYSTKWVSTHGENGAWSYDPTSGGKAYRGMNGYLIGRINWTGDMNATTTSSRCWAKDTSGASGYYCGVAGTTGAATRHSGDVGDTY